MGFLFSRLGRYLFVRYAAGVGLILAAVTATVMLIDLVEELRLVGTRAQITILDAFGLTLLKTPHLLEQTLPFVVLAGTMLAASQLNAKSELVAARAAGVSAWRFLAPAAALAFLVGVFSVTLLNPIGARTYSAFEAAKNSLLSGAPGARLERRTDLWLRQGDEAGQIVINAREIDPLRGRLTGVVMFFFDVDDGGALRFARRLTAESAILTAGIWQLADVVEAAPGAAPTRAEALSVPARIEPEQLIEQYETPQMTSFWELPGAIRAAREAGLAPSNYTLRWHALIATPLLLAAMAGLGAVSQLRLQRLGGRAWWTLGGLAAGFGLYFLGQFAGAFAAADLVAPALAAWAFPVAGLFAAMAALGYLEDG